MYTLTVFLNVVVKFSSPRNIEHWLCVHMACTAVMFLLTNPVRLHRFSVLEQIGWALSDQNVRWLGSCQIGMVETARDTVRVCLILIMHSFFHIFLNVRTKISKFKPLFTTITGAFWWLSGRL